MSAIQNRYEFVYLFDVGCTNQYVFVTTFLTAEKRYRRYRELQLRRKKTEQRGVGCTLDRWSSQRNLERFSVRTDDAVL